MKVLFVCSTDSMGGANQSLLTMIFGLLPHDFVDIKVLLPLRKNGDFQKALEELGCSLIVRQYTNCVTNWNRNGGITSFLDTVAIS